jgi:hypothetical protein
MRLKCYLRRHPLSDEESSKGETKEQKSHEIYTESKNVDINPKILITTLTVSGLINQSKARDYITMHIRDTLQISGYNITMKPLNTISLC